MQKKVQNPGEIISKIVRYRPMKKLVFTGNLLDSLGVSAYGHATNLKKEVSSHVFY